MKSRCFLLTLFAVVFVPGFLHAQQQTASTQQQRAQATLTVIDALAVRNEKMYEDIEILRRILDRKLTSLYPSVPSKDARTGTIRYGRTPSGTPYVVSPGMLLDKPDIQNQIFGQLTKNPNENLLLFQSSIEYPAAIPLRSLEGIYLKGQGVIYTATLASLHPPEKAEADSVKGLLIAIGQRESEWDSIRRQVRNEKEKPKKTEDSKPPSLSDVLLKVLAENGHHFSQLGENESLTIVLTVRGAERQLPARKTTAKASADPAKSGSQEAKSTAASEVSDLELLGDLHQKQGHYMEALKAFGRAVARESGPSPNEARRLHRKMAQCYLGLGHDESARKSLDQSLNSARKESADAKEKPAPAANPADALPIKLIISVPKYKFDQLKAGHISFEEFRRQASVETLRFGDRH